MPRQLLTLHRTDCEPPYEVLLEEGVHEEDRRGGDYDIRKLGRVAEHDPLREGLLRLVFVDQAVEVGLQRLPAVTRDKEERLEERIPVSDGQEESDCCQEGFR